MSKPAVILLSGGLDSATVLAIARRDGYDCHTLAFDYGQRHRHELDAAADVARALGAASHRVFPLNLGAFGGSALTAPIDVPKGRSHDQMTHGIPITYVPARNLVFLSVGTALCETLEARDLFIGVNAVDYSGYPDCRPEFIEAFGRAANLGTQAGVEGHPLRVHAPLSNLSKAEIIRLGTSLGVPYGKTHSCYDPVHAPGGEWLACGRCDSCLLRSEGFVVAGVADPTRYVT